MAAKLHGCLYPHPIHPEHTSLGQLAVTPEDERVFSFLTYGFPAEYEGPVPSPSLENHASVKVHPRDKALYIATELDHGTMLGPFDQHPFTPWCQVNLLLTHPKKNSLKRRVIMDLSWPFPPAASVNGGTQRYTYLHIYKEMHVPMIWPPSFTE